MARTSVSASRVVDRPPAEVFAFLTDPANHVRMDGSDHLVAAVGEDRLTGVGDRFGMRMRWLVPYTTWNTVVEYEQDRRVAWRHVARHRWRYELAPVDGGTEVTETFDLAPVPRPLRVVYRRLFGFPDAYVTVVERSLDRLAEVLATAEV